MREIEAWSAKNQSEVNRNLIGNVSWSKHGIREVRNFTFYYVKFQFLGNIQQLPSTPPPSSSKTMFFSTPEQQKSPAPLLTPNALQSPPKKLFASVSPPRTPPRMRKRSK